MGLGNIFKKGDYNEASTVLSIKELKLWVAQLPLLDTAKSAVMLEAMLQRLAKTSLDELAVSRHLRLLYAPLVRIGDAFYADYYNENQLEPTERQAQLFFVRELHLAFAAMCVEQIQGAAQRELKKFKRADMLSYACAAYGEALLRSYQLSMLLPKGVWQTLYTLYSYIGDEEKQQAVEQEVETKHLPYQQSADVLFKRCLILAMADPYQLTAGELDKLYHFAISPHVKLPIVQDNGRLGEFLFTKKCDLPPIHRHFAEDVFDNVQCHALDTHILLKKLSEATTLKRLSPSLCEKLTLAWQTPAGRTFERDASTGSYQVIGGMSALHRHLLGKASPTISQADDAASGFIKDDDEVTPSQHILAAYEYSQAELPERQTNHRETVWHSVNSSENGLKLISRIDYPPNQLSSGLLVGLQQDEKANCMTAFVRWVTINAERDVQMGLQLIARDNQAVFVQNSRQKRHGYRSSAFLVASPHAPYQQAMLITAALSYHPGDSLFLQQGDKEIEIVLGGCVEETIHCKLFTFETP